jgi:hypothetical protein
MKPRISESFSNAHPFKVHEPDTISQSRVQLMCAYQTRGCRDQIGVVPCRFTVRQQRYVFKPSTNTMPAIKSTPIDGPTRYAVTVVNLLQRNARGHHDIFHLGCMLNSSVRIGVKRFDKDAATPAC